MSNNTDLPIAPGEPWRRKPGFDQIAEAIEVQPQFRHNMDALTELVYGRGIQATMDDGGTTAFLKTYPWERDFESAREVVDRALERRHATAERGLDAAAVHREPRSLEDHVVTFADALRGRASDMEAEGPGATVWFPKSPRQALALSFALMLWLYLERIPAEAAMYDRGSKPYVHALTYLRLCFRCARCSGGFASAAMPGELPWDHHVRLVLDTGEVVESPTTM